VSKGSAGPVNVSRPEVAKMRAIEMKISDEFSTYIDLDISNIVASMMRMGYTPL